MKANETNIVSCVGNCVVLNILNNKLYKDGIIDEGLRDKISSEIYLKLKSAKAL